MNCFLTHRGQGFSLFEVGNDVQGIEYLSFFGWTKLKCKGVREEEGTDVTGK